MSPVSYYASDGRWDLSPGYQRYANLYLTRPVTEPCWNCHSSGTRRIEGTVNRYDDPPFEEAGVACERCHGPGGPHVSMRGGTILNPAKLPKQQRDDVCAQCHFTGATRIERPHRSLRNFEPGNRLSDYVTIFVDSGPAKPPRATDHFESLSSSVCSIRSGGQLWCGTCHNIHSPPPEGAAEAYYRTKCLGCHHQDECREDRQARLSARDHCTSCHMPKTAVSDVLHAAYTDHRIQARPNRGSAVMAQGRLVAFGSGAPQRDVAIAEAEIAFQYNDPSSVRDAFQRMRDLEPSLTADAQALTVLGRLYDLEGNNEKARELYYKAISLDQSQVEAAVNLGAIVFGEGDSNAAIDWWRLALHAQPALEAAHLNIARALASQGRIEEARKELLLLMDFSPDHPLAVKELNALAVARPR